MSINPRRPTKIKDPAECQVIVKLNAAPGDTIAATSFVRDFKIAFPRSRIQIACAGSDEIFLHNPYHSKLKGDDVVHVTVPSYKPWLELVQKGEPVPYAHAMHVSFEKATGISFARGYPAHELFLSNGEEVPPEDAFQYWVIAPGWKTDIPAKAYPPEFFQKVVDRTGRLSWVQVGATSNPKHRIQHVNPPLNRARDLRGRTTLREMFRLIAFSRGVLGLVSMPMLVAQAFNRTAVIVSGNRECTVPFEHPKTTILRSDGLLSCATSKGCYCVGVNRAHDKEYPTGYLCLYPDRGYPRCTTLISPDSVAAAVTAADKLYT